MILFFFQRCLRSRAALQRAPQHDSACSTWSASGGQGGPSLLVRGVDQQEVGLQQASDVGFSCLRESGRGVRAGQKGRGRPRGHREPAELVPDSINHTRSKTFFFHQVVVNFLKVYTQQVINQRDKHLANDYCDWKRLLDMQEIITCTMKL